MYRFSILLVCGLWNYYTMTLQKFRRLLYLFFSIYLFLQCTFFMSNAAHLLFILAAPKINGEPALFSPYNMISYCNIVFYSGLGLSSIMFVLACEPFIADRIKKKRISIPLAIIATPFYFFFLFSVATGTAMLFQ